MTSLYLSQHVGDGRFAETQDLLVCPVLTYLRGERIEAGLSVPFIKQVAKPSADPRGVNRGILAGFQLVGHRRSADVGTDEDDLIAVTIGGDTCGERERLRGRRTWGSETVTAVRSRAGTFVPGKLAGELGRGQRDCPTPEFAPRLLANSQRNTLPESSPGLLNSRNHPVQVSKWSFEHANRSRQLICRS